MENEKICLVVKEESFFLIKPEEISTTGFRPSRGVYKRLTLSDGSKIWLNNSNREIDNSNWVDHLENCCRHINS